jgi:Uncharacterised nucleotidyltransferase
MAPSSSSTVCPEKRLLVCCARTEMPPAVAEEICCTAAGPLDWKYLFREAAENSVTPLLARHLRLCVPNAPARELQALNDAARANVARSLVLTGELIHLLDVFRSADIQAIPYKGPVLAAQAYGDLSLREFGDLDIVMRQRDIIAAHKMMVSLGFCTPSMGRFSADESAIVPGEYSYRDETRGLIVELHTERTLRHFPVAPDLDLLAARTAPVLLAGREVRTFAAEEGLTLLSVHGSKDLWERLSWVVDIAEMIRAHPGLDWDLAFRFARSVEAERMLDLALLLSVQLLDARIPAEVSTHIRRDRTTVALAQEFQRRLLARTWSPFGSAARFNLRRRMVAGNGAGLAYALGLAFTPTQDDWSSLHLPRSLVALYVLLRPIRLFRKYGMSSNRSSRPS